MIDQNMVDDIKACAEKLLNTSKALYDVTQTMTANKSGEETAKEIVSIEGYLELVGGGKRDVNKARKMIVQELNVDEGIMR
jgi:hypothetical protein